MDVVLELRPICENCAIDLPPTSAIAMICTYECTFCARCVEQVLHDVCPNCAGGFSPRPVRPSHEWRPGVSVAHQPPTSERRHRPVDSMAHAQLIGELAGLPPDRR